MTSAPVNLECETWEFESPESSKVAGQKEQGLPKAFKNARRRFEGFGRVFADVGRVQPENDCLQNNCMLKVRDEVSSEFPFLHEFLLKAKTRENFLDEEGKLQRLCPSSANGWVATIFILNARALDWIILPWIVVTLHAVLYIVISSNIPEFNHDRYTSEWHPIFTFSLNTTLGFLLVFRLNRAAERFWQARLFWGQIVVLVRTLVSGLLVHGSGAPTQRDEALRWLAAFPLTAKDFIRGEAMHHPDAYAGILSVEELSNLQRNSHAPLYAAHEVRRNLNTMFRVSAETNPAYAASWAHQMNFMEDQLNRLLEAEGGLERIKGTPLPLVYVSHLRTFMLINLFLIPWVWG